MKQNYEKTESKSDIEREKKMTVDNKRDILDKKKILLDKEIQCVNDIILMSLWKGMNSMLTR